MPGDHVQITPGYGAEHLARDEMDSVLSELWDSDRFRDLLQIQREKAQCLDLPCLQEYKFEKVIRGRFVAEVLACKKCRQIVVNLTRRAAA